MAEIKNKIFKTSIKKMAGLPERVLCFVASDETVDRDGDVIQVAGWDLGNFSKNAPFMLFHDYKRLPIGKIIKAEKDLRNKQLLIYVQFPTAEELNPGMEPGDEVKTVETVYQMYLNNYLSAVSVGCSYLEATPREEGGYLVSKAELLEVSAVPIPANPNAIVQMRSIKSIDKDVIEFIEKAYIEEKSAIPYKKYPLADEDTKWDAGKIVADSTVEDLAIICTWKADKKPEDMTKGDYKLPHHLGKSDGYKLVKAGVIAAVGALRGARGGVELPEADKPGVEKHLKKHYEDLSLDWPEDKDAWVAQAKAFGIDTNEAKSVEPIVTKEGRRLSSATLAMIDSFGDCIKELDESIAACKSTRDKLAVKIDELRNGASSEEPDESMEEPEDEDGEKSFVIELVE